MGFESKNYVQTIENEIFLINHRSTNFNKKKFFHIKWWFLKYKENNWILDHDDQFLENRFYKFGCEMAETEPLYQK